MKDEGNDEIVKKNREKPVNEITSENGRIKTANKKSP